MARFVVGDDRSQSTLFPERLDEYLGEDNPVRAIDVLVDELDLAKRFDGVEPEATGRPAYHPATLLKVYVYGYLNRVQSSRRLERECQRNIELVWLTGRLMPDFKTIADFRKDNGEAIRKVCREFVVLCRRLELFSEASVAIDGSKFKAVNTRDRNFTQAKMERRLAQIDESIRAADSRARALLPTIRKLMAAGFASDRVLANELNRRGLTGARGGRWHRSSVRRMLTRLRRLTSAHGGTNSNLAFKPVADVRAKALAPTIAKLRRAGFVSIQAIARELNERGIPTPRGAKWHHTTVERLLTRLGLITLGRGRANNRLAQKRAADARAKALASTIRKLRKAGFVSVSAITRELNKRQVPTARGGKWHRKSVSQLVQRLEKLEP
jgi:transposase